jgi:hypothetical protein
MHKYKSKIQRENRDKREKRTGGSRLAADWKQRGEEERGGGEKRGEEREGERREERILSRSCICCKVLWLYHVVL